MNDHQIKEFWIDATSKRRQGSKIAAFFLIVAAVAAAGMVFQMTDRGHAVGFLIASLMLMIAAVAVWKAGSVKLTSGQGIQRSDTDTTFP